MVQPEGKPLPEWARDDRSKDLAFLNENRLVLWSAAQNGFRAFGRGALVIDGVSRRPGQGHPFFYLPQEGIATIGDPDALRMVAAYVPESEFVSVIVKPYGRVSTYRIRVPIAGKGEVVATREDPQRDVHVPDGEDVELLRRANEGLLPCPRCGKPLRGMMVDSSPYQGVVLSCEGEEGCGFLEW